MARQKRPSDAVQFTFESAQRIAGVIRAAELAVPAAAPLTFERRASHSAPSFKVVSFTGVWVKSQVRLFVTNVGTATASFGAYNYFATVGTANTSVSTMAALARVPNITQINWVLIAAECNE